MKFVLPLCALGICAIAIGTLIWRSEIVAGKQEYGETRRSEPPTGSVPAPTSDHQSDAAGDPSALPSTVEPTPVESSQGFAFGTNAGTGNGGGYLGGFCGSLGALGGNPTPGGPSAGVPAYGMGGALGGGLAPVEGPLQALPAVGSPAN